MSDPELDKIFENDPEWKLQLSVSDVRQWVIEVKGEDNGVIGEISRYKPATRRDEFRGRVELYVVSEKPRNCLEFIQKVDEVLRSSGVLDGSYLARGEGNEKG